MYNWSDVKIQYMKMRNLKFLPRQLVIWWKERQGVKALSLSLDSLENRAN